MRVSYGNGDAVQKSKQLKESHSKFTFACLRCSGRDMKGNFIAVVESPDIL
jgi:hypothetical protein